MSPIKVTRVKGDFWDRWDDFFDVPALWCFIVWGVTFASHQAYSTDLRTFEMKCLDCGAVLAAALTKTVRTPKKKKA